MTRFTAVWADNFEREMGALDRSMSRFPIVAFDTEFPGFLRSTPRGGSESLRYQDMKFNVDHLKVIQLGLTVFDENGIVGGTWEFNFQDFDERVDAHVPASIALLKNNGLDFEQFGKYGVDSKVFAERFVEVVGMHRGTLQWVSFHGFYDSGYLIKLLTSKPLPESVTEFAKIASWLFERVYDVKFMEKYCPGLYGGEIGLERTAKILEVERRGGAHQAGSDSLLTAEVFVKMRNRYGLKAGMYEGFLYGFSPKISASTLQQLPHRHGPPRRPVILVPVIPNRPTMLIRRCPSYQAYQNQTQHLHLRPSPLRYPAAAPLLMPQPHPLCSHFAAGLPQAHRQYQIHM